MRGGNGVFIGSRRLQQTRTHKNARVVADGYDPQCTFLGDKKYYRLCLLEAKNVTMVLLLFFLYFSIVQYIRIVVEPLEKNAPHLAISRLRDALSYKAVKGEGWGGFLTSQLLKSDLVPHMVSSFA